MKGRRGRGKEEEEEASTKSMEGAGRMIYWIPVRGGGMVVTDKEQVAHREESSGDGDGRRY